MPYQHGAKPHEFRQYSFEGLKARAILNSGPFG